MEKQGFRCDSRWYGKENSRSVFILDVSLLHFSFRSKWNPWFGIREVLPLWSFILLLHTHTHTHTQTRTHGFENTSLCVPWCRTVCRVTHLQPEAWQVSTNCLGARVTSPRARRLADPAGPGNDIIHIIRVPSVPPAPPAAPLRVAGSKGKPLV